MGVQLRFGTAGATGGGWSSRSGALQPSFLDAAAEPKWSYQQRSPKTRKDRNCWYSLWSYGCRVGNADVNMDGATQRGMNFPDLYEPYSCDGEGTQTTRFIRGQCLDEDSNPSAGAIVQGFRTLTDAYVGEVQSNLDGTYNLPTDTPAGTAHYLAAYKPGSPDIAGTTVNTILPTNVDGS